MDLQAGQTFWTRLFQRLGVVSSVYQFLRRVRRELKDTAIRVEEYNDIGKYLSQWVLSGVVLGENTDKNGLLYVKITMVGIYLTDVKVELFTDSPRTSGLVASGTILAGSLPGICTLTEENSSGISGSIHVAASTAATDEIWLRPKIGMLGQIQNLPIDDSIDGYFIADMEARLTNVVNNIGSALSVVESFARTYMWPYIARKIDTGKSGVRDMTAQANAGVVSENWQEILKEFYDTLHDETDPGRQWWGTFGLAMTPITWDADNVGKGKLSGWPFMPAAIGMYRWGQSMVVTFECVSASIGLEAFQVVGRTYDGASYRAEQRLTIDKSWLSPILGITGFTITHDPVDSGAEANHFSNWQVLGVLDSNSDGGKLYCTISGGGTVVDFYSDSGRTVKVASGAISGGQLSISEFNGSGISGNATVTGTPADGNGLEIDIKPFAVGDKFYANQVVTEVDQGRIEQGGEYLDALMGVVKFYPQPGFGPAPIDEEVGDRGFSGLSTEIGTV